MRGSCRLCKAARACSTASVLVTWCASAAKKRLLMHEVCTMDFDRQTRRQVLGSGAAVLAWAAASRAVQAQDRGELRFRLEETAGLRRFGYPVSVVLPGVTTGNHFQLIRNGQHVPAQFRATDGPDG